MADWLKSILATDAAFVVCSLAALAATIAVAIGLVLEYERHELIGLSKKQIGSMLVVGGVTLEAVFGLGAFVSATIRESRLESELIAVQARPRLLAYGKERILEQMKPYEGQKIAVFLALGDSEQADEEIDIGSVFLSFVVEAKWSPVSPIEHPRGYREMMGFDDHLAPYFDTGLEVEIDDHATPRTKDAAEALRSAIANERLRIGDTTKMFFPRPPLPVTDANTILFLIFPRPAL